MTTTTTTTTCRRGAAVVLGIGVLVAGGGCQSGLPGADGVTTRTAAPRSVPSPTGAAVRVGAAVAGAQGHGVPRGLATERSASQEQPAEDRLAIAAGSRLVAAVLDFSARHPGEPLPASLTTPAFAAAQVRVMADARRQGTRFSGSDRVVAVAPVSITYSPDGTAVVMSACLEKHTSVTRGGAEVRRGPDGDTVRQGQRLATLYDVAVQDGAARLTGMQSGDRC